ncbi:MAG: hypothetical protein WC627_02685 [Legionella sp.]
MQFFKSQEIIPAVSRKKFVTTKLYNEDLIIYLCDGAADSFENVPGFNDKKFVANYFSSTNKLHIHRYSSDSRLEETHTVDCYYYDEPGQQAFVTSRHNEEVCISTVGPNPICIQVPSLNKESSDLRYLEISGIQKFTNSNQGFDIKFTQIDFLGSDTSSTKLIKKIFIKKLLGQIQATEDKAIVASSSKPIMKMMKFTWVNENTNKWEHVPIDIAVWSREITPSSNAENELEMNDLATTDSKIVGHLYSNGTFRVTEICQEAPWMVNVRPFTGWLCQTKHDTFLVANHHYQSYVSLEKQALLINLPTKFTSSNHIKIVKAYTLSDDDASDSFYVQFHSMESIPQEYSIDDLIDSKKFTNKYRSQHVKGVWVGTSSYGGKLYADFNLWPDIDYTAELDGNKKREENIDNAETYRSDIGGHCYPKNQQIKLATKKTSILRDRYVQSNITGTYYETTDNSVKKAAIIAVINNVRPGKQDTEDKEKSTLLTTIKKYMIQQILVVDKFELAQEVIEKVVESIAQQLFAFSTGTVEDITGTINRFKIIDKITNHAEIKKFINASRKRGADDKLSLQISALNNMFGNSTETKISEIVTSDVLSSCKFAKLLYVMIDKNFEAEKNLRISIEEGYQDIKFTDDEIRITYSDKIVTHKLADLILQPKKDFMSKHHVLTIEIEPISYLSARRKKTVLSVWKDLTVQDDQYTEEFDNSIKTSYATSSNLKQEDIDVAHLYSKNSSLWIVNNYDGRARGPDNVVHRGWMVNKDTESLIVIQTEIQCMFIYVDKHKKHHLYKEYTNEFLNQKDSYPAINSISLDESGLNLVVKHRDSFQRRSEESEQIFTFPFKALLEKCTSATNESDSMLSMGLDSN